MANRYFLNIGTLWGSTANWSDTSGGTGGFSIPTSADDVFFDANSGNCTLASSTRTAKSINFTGYTNTITFDVGLDVYGSVTLSSGMTIAGVGTLSLYATGSLTSNGKLWQNLLVFRGTSQTYTLIDNWTVGSLQGLASTAATINGNTINVNGDLTITGTAIYSGTTNIVLSGTGTYSQNSTGQLRNNLTISTGTITISGNVYYNTGTLTYLSGIVKANTATLNVALATTFINCDKINFKAITITAATTQTFNKFFSGSAIVPTRIQSTSTTSNYTIAFQDNFEKITKFTRISNCTVSRRGQLLCLTDRSNKGGNVGIRYINQLPDGVPKNSPSTPNPMTYGISQVADPSFQVL
jgi:hypothetical protein